MTAQHPYYPLGLELPGYQPPVWPFQHVLAVFFGGSALVFLVTLLYTGSFKKVPAVERTIACWFVVTGIIHFVIEGYVVAVPGWFKDTRGHILSEIWKEYAKADSRYATRDAFIIAMEAVTAFVEGPACFVIAYGVLTRRAWRYTLMMLVSLGQIYGDVLYYATCLLEGAVHTRPEALYYWFYFVIVNAIWIVIPSTVIVYAARCVSAAVGGAEGGRRKAE